MERKAEMNLRKPMHGVRWQSEARTPTPLWLGNGYSWSLHTPHGGGLTALLETTGCFGTRERFPAKAVWRYACHRTPYFGGPCGDNAWSAVAE
jgi:hypothetical protein